MEFKVDYCQVMEMLAREASPPGSDIMSRIGEFLHSSTQHRLKNQIAPDGTAWQSLKARYAERKKYNPDKILTPRGYLRRGIRHQVTGDTSLELEATGPMRPSTSGTEPTT